MIGDAHTERLLRGARSRASVVAAVGSGCAVLASAGLLRGHVALDPVVAAEVAGQGIAVWDSPSDFVDQGDLMTARTTASETLGLHLVRRRGGTRLARAVAQQRGLEWNEHAGIELPPTAGEGLF